MYNQEPMKEEREGTSPSLPSWAPGTTYMYIIKDYNYYNTIHLVNLPVES